MPPPLHPFPLRIPLPYRRDHPASWFPAFLDSRICPGMARPGESVYGVLEDLRFDGNPKLWCAPTPGKRGFRARATPAQ